ncbi:hypothetical protein MBANPS3_011848 [Mucor bainieri]
MSTEIPALPPRKPAAAAAAATTTHIDSEAKALLDRPFYSPMALLTRLETTMASDHQHNFKRLVANNNLDQQSAAAALEETALQGSTTFRLICTECHVSLTVQHNHKEPSVTCSATDYLCHHFHSQGVDQFECCGCQYTLTTKMSQPALPLTLLKEVETRPETRSYVELLKEGDNVPTVISTYATVLVYIRDLLKGAKRDINAKNPHFLARIGLENGSRDLMEAIGFQDDKQGYFKAPEIEAGSPEEERLKQMQQELILSLDTRRQKLGALMVPITSGELNFAVQPVNMQQLLGVNASLETRKTAPSKDINDAYAALGLTPGASDELVAWTYSKVISEPSTIMHEQDAIDSLEAIATHTNSEALETLLACELSNGKTCSDDITRAYEYLQVPSDADDEGLKTMYRLKLSDQPEAKKTIQEKLQTIAVARNSQELLQFLGEENGITASTSGPSAKDLMTVPAHTIHNQSSKEWETPYWKSPYSFHSDQSWCSFWPTDRPVGLENIASTCYLNSLLQYYYTLLPFRETILNIDKYIEDDNCEPKKIGGIKVSPSEVQRTKKSEDACCELILYAIFTVVLLLKKLFQDMQETTAAAVKPEHDLAYMALISESKEEEDTAAAKDAPQAEQQPATMDSKTTLAVPATPGSPASSAMLKDFDNTIIQSEATLDILPPVSPLDPGSPEEDTSDNGSSTTPMQLDTSSGSPPPAYQDLPSTSAATTQPDKKQQQQSLTKKPSLQHMMLGKQQDVGECMGNVMYLVEAALKPLSRGEDGEQLDDMIRQTFYGKLSQIVSYRDDITLQNVKSVQEEDFSHIIVNASDDMHIYDGLDEYFSAEKLDKYQGGHDATREETIKSLPPVLQILVQRVQFDRATFRPFKSNAYIQLEKTIYLDRYADANFVALAEKRQQVAAWRAELATYKEQVNKYTKAGRSNLFIPAVLEAAGQILHDFSLQETSTDMLAKYNTAKGVLEEEARKAKQWYEASKTKVESLKNSIQQQYADYTQMPYNLHAVFIHEGEASHGHYWVYIYDHKGDQWWKYNDATVHRVSETEILKSTAGSTANPYFLVYVDAAKLDDCVQTIRSS